MSKEATTDASRQAATRAEALAAIFLMQVPQPAHLRIDNRAALGYLAEEALHRHWLIERNGDIRAIKSDLESILNRLSSQNNA